MMAMARMQSPPPPPIEVKVDRPFLYAIQHVPSGACLFIGRVIDPR
jgi:serine protease inhibitor